MNRDRLLSRLWAGVLAFLLSVGTAGCLASAFEFPMPWQVLAILGGICLVAAVLCSFRFGETVGLALLSAAAVYLWRRGSLSAELDTLVYQISRCYHSGYGWPVFGWIENRDPELTVALPFILIGAFVALVTARVVTRRSRSFWAIAAAAPAFSLCIVLNDTVPAVPYLMMVLFAIILLLMTQSLRRRDTRQGNRLTAMLALPLAAALAVLFAAMPQTGYTPPPEDLAQRCAVWFQELELGQELVDRVVAYFVGRNSETINLKDTGPRGDQKFKVMEVTADTEGLLYLRGRAYDVYDGRQWLASGGEWALDSDYQEITALGQVNIRTNSVHDLLYFPVNTADSTISAISGGYLANPEGLDEYEMLWFHGYANLLAPSRYKLSSDGAGTHQITGSAEVLASQLAGQYLALPDHTREAALEYLKANMPRFIAEPEDHSKNTSIRVGDTHYELPITAASDMKTEADFICDLVRNSARYDLKTRKMPTGEKDFAMWFLRSSDTGYCVHFATAATVLLRAAGIPARYVEGYLVDAREDMAVAVLGEDAHAWVEYWIPGYGWQLLEATPGYGTASGTAPTEPEETAPETTLPDDTQAQTQTRPNVPDRPDVTRPVIPGGETTAPTEGGIPLIPGGDGEGPVLDLSAFVPVLKWLAGLALALGILWGQWKLRLKARLKRLSRGTPNEQALRYWRLLGKMWKALKMPPEEALEALAQKAKFSQHTLTPDELERFTACRSALTEIMERKALPLRLWYRIVLAFY